MKKMFFALLMLAMTAMISFAGNAPGNDIVKQQVEMTAIDNVTPELNVLNVELMVNTIFLLNESEVEISFGLVNTSTYILIEGENSNYSNICQASIINTNAKEKLITTNTTADQLTRLNIGLNSNNVLLISNYKGKTSHQFKEPITRLSIGDRS